MTKTKLKGLTQRVHPLESIAEGGFYYYQNLEEYKNLKPWYGWKIGAKGKDNENRLPTRKPVFEETLYRIQKSLKIYNVLDEDDIKENNSALASFVSNENNEGKGIRDTFKPFINYPDETKFCTIDYHPEFKYWYIVDSNGFTKFMATKDENAEKQNAIPRASSGPGPDTKQKMLFDDSKLIPDAEAGIKYFLQITEADVQKSKNKMNLLKECENKGNMLDLIKNDFQGFYYSLKTDIKRKRIKGFTPEFYNKAEKIATDAQYYYEDHEGENNYDDLFQKLNEFREELQNLKNEANGIREIKKTKEIDDQITKLSDKPNTNPEEFERLSPRIERIQNTERRLTLKRRLSQSISCSSERMKAIIDQNILAKKEVEKTPRFFINV